jgi:hypothetical protein
MNSRELLQRRKMLENGDTIWEDSQLVKAAKEGRLCVLDGIDRGNKNTQRLNLTRLYFFS